MRTESMDPRQRPEVGEQAANVARELGEAARDQAHAAWDDAKATAHDKLAEHKDITASGLGDLAMALHEAAQRLEHERHPDVARLAHTAAGGLERVASTLQGKDLDTLVRDTEDFARRQPVAFFAGAMAAGFLAVRFLKSSERARERDERGVRGDGGRENESDEVRASAAFDDRARDRAWADAPGAGGDAVRSGPGAHPIPPN